MKSIIKKSNKKVAFTIIELLTVMSIIVILFGLLVPALNMVGRYAKEVKQNAQFHSIEAALELFNGDFEGYPPSDRYDPNGVPYCGAMKLAEALMGQDLLGFNPNSHFRADGTTGDIYPDPFNPDTDSAHLANLRSRKGPYLPVDGANAYTLVQLYGSVATSTFTGDAQGDGGLVLCDEYPRTRNRTTGKRVGMPVLYYKADTSKTKHDDTDIGDNTQNIYNSKDNIDLIDLGLPWKAGVAHHMASSGTNQDGDLADETIFYKITRNENIRAADRPYNPDSYILISAGFDGLYGTDDDIFNFEK